MFLEIKIFGAVLAMGRFGIDPNLQLLVLTTYDTLQLFSTAAFQLSF